MPNLFTFWDNGTWEAEAGLVENYTMVTADPPNSFSGSGYVTSNGNNFHLVNFTSLLNLMLSQSTLPAFDSTHVTITIAASMSAGVTTFSFIINGNLSAANIASASNTLKLHDNTTSTDYAATLVNDPSHAVTVQFIIPNVSGHSFTLSGALVFNGG